MYPDNNLVPTPLRLSGVVVSCEAMVHRLSRELRGEERSRIVAEMERRARTVRASHEAFAKVVSQRRMIVHWIVLALALGCAVLLMRFAGTLAGLMFGIAVLSATICGILVVWSVMGIIQTHHIRSSLAAMEQSARDVEERARTLPGEVTEVTFVIGKAWNVLLGDHADPNCDMWIVLYELDNGSYILTHFPGICDLTGHDLFSGSTLGSSASMLVLATGETYIMSRWEGEPLTLRQLVGFHAGPFVEWYHLTSDALSARGGQGYFLECEADKLPAWLRERLCETQSA